MPTFPGREKFNCVIEAQAVLTSIFWGTKVAPTKIISVKKNTRNTQRQEIPYKL